MKKNFLILSLVSLSLTVVGAKAASTQNDSRIVSLPAYEVESPRYSAAEQQVNRSLGELRALARTPVAVPVEVPAIGEKPAANQTGLAAKYLPMLVLAKS